MLCICARVRHAYRIVVCASARLAILSVTGVYVWWKKRRRGSSTPCDKMGTPPSRHVIRPSSIEAQRSRAFMRWRAFLILTWNCGAALVRQRASAVAQEFVGGTTEDKASDAQISQTSRRLRQCAVGTRRYAPDSCFAASTMARDLARRVSRGFGPGSVELGRRRAHRIRQGSSSALRNDHGAFARRQINILEKPEADFSAGRRLTRLIRTFARARWISTRRLIPPGLCCSRQSRLAESKSSSITL